MANIKEYICSPGIRDRLILVVAGLLLYLPFLGSVNLFDWDEINFAEAAREMIVTGEYMRVQINFQPFWEKPPFFFWMQVLSMKIFGINEFAARYVNALCGIITLLAVYSVGRRIYSTRFGMLWALAFMGSVMPLAFFRSGIIDPVFNLFIFLGIVSLFRGIMAKGPGGLKNFIFAGVMVGIAVLTKGPVAFLIVCLCITVYWASVKFRRIMTVKELAIFIAATCMVSFLFYGIETLMHGTWFMREFVKYHIRLLRTGEAGHGRPFYYHFVVLLFGCFPASILAIRSLFSLPAGKTYQNDFKKWMLITFWVVLILFSIVKTKTVLYSSMAYYPLTFLAAWHLYQLAEGRCRWRSRETALLLVFSVILAMLFISFPILMAFRESIIPLISDRFTAACISMPAVWTGFEGAPAGAFIFAALACIWMFSRGRFISGSVILWSVSALTIVTILILLEGRIENHTQRPFIEFYKAKAGKDCYVESLFKTYADLFYLEKMPPKNKKAYSREWLLAGAIDKPAFFVSRIHRADRYIEKYGLEKLYTKGGFVFMKRDVAAETYIKKSQRSQ